LRKSQM